MEADLNYVMLKKLVQNSEHINRIKQGIYVACHLLFLLMPVSPVHAAVINAPQNSLTGGLNSGLVLMQSFNGPDIFGTTALDRSGQGNNGTLTNGPTVTKGKVGQALFFDDRNSTTLNNFVNVGTDSSLNTTGDMTISAWVRSNDSDGYVTIISKYIVCADSNAIYNMDILPSGGGLRFILGNGSTNFKATKTLALDNQWHHVVARVSGTTMTAFVDASPGTNVTFTGTRQSDSTKPTILGDIDNGIANCQGGELEGSLDDVRLYNRALTAAEVKRLYQLGNPAPASKSGSKDGLVGYYRMDEPSWNGTAREVRDASALRNDATAVGGATTVKGKFSKAGNFSGSTASVTISPAITLGARSTLVGWYNLTGATNNFNPIWGQNGFNEVRYGSGASSGKLDILKSGAVIFTSTTNVVANSWHFLAIVDDGTALRAYYDGVDMGNSVGSYTSLSGIAIGRMTQGENANNFNGQIDEARIYNRALTSAEVTSLYQSRGAALTNAPQNSLTGSLSSGLVLMQSFNGPDIFGTTALDRSGQGNNGTLTNGPTVTKGKVGQALKFDGVNDYVDLGVSSSLNIQNAPFSISAWALFDSSMTDTYNSIFLKVGDSSNRPQYRFGRNFNTTSGHLSYFNTSNAYVDLITSAGYYISGFHHYAVSITTSGASFYRDGVLFQAIANTLNNMISGSFSAYIGRNIVDSSFWKGPLDEVRVYNRALTAAEVLRLYNIGK